MVEKHARTINHKRLGQSSLRAQRWQRLILLGRYGIFLIINNIVWIRHSHLFMCLCVTETEREKEVIKWDGEGNKGDRLGLSTSKMCSDI